MRRITSRNQVQARQRERLAGFLGEAQMAEMDPAHAAEFTHQRFDVVAQIGTKRPGAQGEAVGR